MKRRPFLVASTASRESFAQAASALIFAAARIDDGVVDQATANACNMQGGGGVKRFAKCPIDR